MKILTATKETQGQRRTDFSFTVPGEMVMFGMSCDSADCGCDRALVGLITRKSTTTFTVAEHKLTVKQYRELIRASVEEAFGIKITKMELDADAHQLLQIAKHFAVGEVLEIDGKKIRARN